MPREHSLASTLKPEVALNKQERSGCVQPRQAWREPRMVTGASRALTCSESSGTICRRGWSRSWLRGSCLSLKDPPEPALPAFQTTATLQCRLLVAPLVTPRVTRPNIRPKQYGLISIYEIA